MIEAVRISETLVCSFETTLHCIPEGCNLYNLLGEKLKSYKFVMMRTESSGKLLRTKG